MQIERYAIIATIYPPPRKKKNSLHCQECFSHTQLNDLLNLYSKKRKIQIKKYTTLCRCLFEILGILHIFFYLCFTIEKQNHDTHIYSQIIQRCVLECDRHLNVFICCSEEEKQHTEKKNVRFKWNISAKPALHNYTQKFLLYFLSLFLILPLYLINNNQR